MHSGTLMLTFLLLRRPMSTYVQMYKCGGCEGQFDVDEALGHQQNRSRIYRGAKILPIRCTRRTTHKNDLLASSHKSSRKPSSSKKASSSQTAMSARTVARQMEVPRVGFADSNLIYSGSGSTRVVAKEDPVSSSSEDHDRSHDPLLPVHEPTFSLTDVFVRAPTPFAFIGLGSATRDEYDHPYECHETDYSIDYPISYEDLRDKLSFAATASEFSPNDSLYLEHLPEQQDNRHFRNLVHSDCV
ncbi:hypothetical protein PILCRDRAFT_308942 [Piloderma croceum F 1598]|uniref:C2H2-type domain-containing protein n=1 Tax=Piloderma croceum (strain F 1598) TaxID=765440 RepID=A0A0C3G403_PILCF|nr:hypothetical protein PILCRDRAFT_308942 [Piloderma croceum F 1598]